MPEQLDRCAKAVMAQGKTEDQAYAICNAQMKDATYQGQFRDAAVFDPVEKTAVSVRDGVIKYLGAELGMEPADYQFTVYRSPATIANAAMRMDGIPITSEHVDLEVEPPANGGFVSESQMVDAYDSLTATTIAIKNKLAIGDTLAPLIEAEKRELSLGYHATLIPHNEYDFEQVNITPHHLAAVERGRCGPMCSFLDKQPDPKDKPMAKKSDLHQAFLDAEGQMNLQQIVEIATGIPEAIKAVPVDQLQKLLPALQQIMEAAKGVMPAEEGGTPAETPAGEMEDEDMSASEEDKNKVPGFSDADMKKAVDTATRRHAAVIEKARGFLPENYGFSDKDTTTIMRDALATETSEKFADAEIELAFKLLKKKESNYRAFGDHVPENQKIDQLKDKEL